MAEPKRPRPRRTPRYSEETIQECLAILESAEVDELFEIIPRLSVMRDERFDPYLVEYLRHDNGKVRLFAAEAMGAIGKQEFLQHLKKVYQEAGSKKRFGGEAFLAAVVRAIGDVGDDQAVEFLLPAFQTETKKGRLTGKLRKWTLEALGAIAQQGGERSITALSELMYHSEPSVREQAISELSCAYWHRPNEVSEVVLKNLQQLTRDGEETVAETALAALQELADIGCRGAERLFSPRSRK